MSPILGKGMIAHGIGRRRRSAARSVKANEARPALALAIS
jgi:hypothetical protein